MRRNIRVLLVLLVSLQVSLASDSELETLSDEELSLRLRQVLQEYEEFECLDFIAFWFTTCGTLYKQKMSVITEQAIRHATDRYLKDHPELTREQAREKIIEIRDSAPAL